MGGNLDSFAVGHRGCLGDGRGICLRPSYELVRGQEGGGGVSCETKISILSSSSSSYLVMLLLLYLIFADSL